MRRLVLFATALLLVLVAASPALAHGDTGLLKLEAAPSAERLGVRISARLVYANDRDPVATATVTVEGTGPNGATLASTPMDSRGDGMYTAGVILPVIGAWTLRANAIEPTASAETRVVIPDVSIDTTTTRATTTTTTPATSPTTEPVRADASADGSSSGGWALVVGGVALLAALAVGAIWVRTRRRATT